MKDFDQERADARAATVAARTFKFAGETFVMRHGVRPEVLQAWASTDFEAADIGDVIAMFDRMVLDFVEPEGNKTARRWAKVRASEDDPVTLEDINKLANWLMEAQSGRPTEQPSPSGDGLATTETTSTGDSSSPDTPTESTD